MSDEPFYHLIVGFLVSVAIVVILCLGVLGLPLHIMAQPPFLMLTVSSGLIGAFLWLFIVVDIKSQNGVS